MVLFKFGLLAAAAAALINPCAAVNVTAPTGLSVQTNATGYNKSALSLGGLSRINLPKQVHDQEIEELVNSVQGLRADGFDDDNVIKAHSDRVAGYEEAVENNKVDPFNKINSCWVWRDKKRRRNVWSIIIARNHRYGDTCGANIKREFRHKCGTWTHLIHNFHCARLDINLFNTSAAVPEGTVLVNFETSTRCGYQGGGYAIQQATDGGVHIRCQYAERPDHQLPYPATLEMLHRFDKGSEYYIEPYIEDGY